MTNHGENHFINCTSKTRTLAVRRIDQGSFQSFDIVPGPLSVSLIQVADSKAGEETELSLEFSSSNQLPMPYLIQIQFPDGFEFTGNVEIKQDLIDQEQSGFDRAFENHVAISTKASTSTLTLTFNTQKDILRDLMHSFTFNKIRMPPYSQNSTSFKVSTQTNQGSVIDMWETGITLEVHRNYLSGVEIHQQDCAAFQLFNEIAVTFETFNPIPSDGKIFMQFPQDFIFIGAETDVILAGNVGCESGPLQTSLKEPWTDCGCPSPDFCESENRCKPISHIDGELQSHKQSRDYGDRTILVTRKGGNATLGDSRHRLTFGNLQNAQTTAKTGHFRIKTFTANMQEIDVTDDSPHPDITTCINDMREAPISLGYNLANDLFLAGFLSSLLVWIRL